MTTASEAYEASYSEEIPAPDVNPGYRVEGFNLLKWYIDFWSDESEDLRAVVPEPVLNGLRLADVLNTDDFAITEVSPPLVRIVHNRCLALKFPATDALIWLIARLSPLPGAAVMWSSALAMAWRDADHQLFVRPDMTWFMSDHTTLYGIAGAGIPGSHHLECMWGLQKIGGRNALDFITLSEGK